MGPGLTSFASSSSVSLLIWYLQHQRTYSPFRLCISTYTFPLLTFCLAEMLFYPYQFRPPHQFAEPHVYLLSQMKWYHWVILSMKDEQGAGNVFHTVKDTTMSQRLREILSVSNTNTLGFSWKLQSPYCKTSSPKV